MSMSKKDFIALAQAIKLHQRACDEEAGYKFSDDQLDTLACFCAGRNPQFKRDRWLGYIDGTNTANGTLTTPERP